MMKFLCGVLSLFLPVLSQSQGEEMLSRFSAAENESRVDLIWTMRAGNLCFGIDLQRTTDTADQKPITVHRIDGICGDDRAEVTYTFSDLNPVSGRVNYYRLLLGATPTSYLAVHVRNFGDGISISPQPASDHITVNFSNFKSESFNLYIFNINGGIVMSRKDIRSESFEVNTHTLPAGVYIYSLTGKNAEYKGKLLISR